MSYEDLNDIESEKIVISCALAKKEALYTLLEYDENVFYFAPHRKIYRMLKELSEAGEDIDLRVLLAKVKESGDHGLVEVVAQLMPGYTINFQYVLRQLAAWQHKRELSDTSADLHKAVSTGKMDYKEFLDKIVEIQDSLNAGKQSEYCTMSELANQDLDELFREESYIPSGFKSLDDHLLGFFKGQLIVLAARPGRGKSTFALNIVENTGYETLFFSLEMKRVELYAKMLSSKAEVETRKIEGKCFDSAESFRISKAHTEIKNTIKMTLFDKGQNFSKIISSIHRFIEIKRPQLIIIDYLQQIKGAPGATQNEKMGNITGVLKNIAMQKDIPIILLSQLSRAVEKENRRPVLSDLRDSGSIEQDADVVIFLHEDQGVTEVIVAKARKGRQGKLLGFKFDKPYSRFLDHGGEVQSFSEATSFGGW